MAFLQDDFIAKTEVFICAVYGYSRLTSVNEVRIKMFNKACRETGNKEPLSKIKGMDGANFPPCQKVLIQQIYRENFTCHPWYSAGALPMPD